MSFDRGCTLTHCWQKYSPPISDWQCQHMLRASGSSFFTIAITASLNKEARLVGRALAAPNDNTPLNGHHPEMLRGERLSAAAALRGVGIAELKLPAQQVLLIVELGPLQVDGAFHIHDHPNILDLVDLIIRADLGIKIDCVTQTRTASAFHPEAQAGLAETLHFLQALDFLHGIRSKCHDRRRCFSLFHGSIHCASVVNDRS